MTPFRVDQDVIVIECDEAGKPREGAPYLYGTVAEAGPCSVSARFGDGTGWLFLLDSRGRAWRDSGRLRLVAACHRCGFPVLGTPVTADDDPLHRQWCSEECRDSEAEASYEQHYPSGVAT